MIQDSVFIDQNSHYHRAFDWFILSVRGQLIEEVDLEDFPRAVLPIPTPNVANVSLYLVAKTLRKGNYRA